METKKQNRLDAVAMGYLILMVAVSVVVMIGSFL